MRQISWFLLEFLIAADLLAARNCGVHRRYVMRGIGYKSWKPSQDILFSKAEQRDILSLMCRLGIRDGMSRELGLCVDGLNIEVTPECH